MRLAKFIVLFTIGGIIYIIIEIGYRGHTHQTITALQQVFPAGAVCMLIEQKTCRP